MKITLIEVGYPTDSLAWKAWIAGNNRFAVPSVGLVSLASLARDKDEVEIIDEKASGRVTTVKADLVGISFKSMYAKRAYELADSLRANGARVVLGGLHASLCPAEAAKHADIVVAGEGESVWPQVLNDVERGNFKPLYKASLPPAPIDKLPRQRIELLKHDRYFIHAVQSARGCSLDCEFCPTRAMFGAGFRLRDVDAVVREVETLLKTEDKPILFTDDVFGAGNPEFISRLTDRLKPLGAAYGVICDMKMLNPEVVRRLAASGCKMMCINMPGTCSPQESAAVQAIQALGINVWGYFMFGFEFHKPDVFPRVIDFVRDCRIKHVSLTVLAPYPGTPMGQRLEKEGRILSRDPDLYDQSHVVFKPANMTPGELETGFASVVKALGDRCNIELIAESMAKRKPAAGASPVPAFLDRTEALLGADCLARFSNSCVAMAGLGGVGGAILPVLVRMGIGHFRISDPGIYDEPDMNRQWAATRMTLGKNKAEVYAQFIKMINPDASVEIISGGVTEANIPEFLKGANIVFDALDLKVPPSLRLKLAAHASAKGMYNICSPIIGFGTVIAIAAPDGMPMDSFMTLVARARGEGKLPQGLLSVFSPAYLAVMQSQMAGRGIVPSIAVAPTLSAAVVATETAMILGGENMPGWRKPVCLPELIVVDLSRPGFRIMRIEELA